MKLGTLQDSFITVPKGKQNELKARYELESKNLQAPLAKGQVVGKVIYQLEGKDIAAVNLQVMDEVGEAGIFGKAWDWLVLTDKRLICIKICQKFTALFSFLIEAFVMCGWCTIHTSFLLLGNNMTTENDYAKLKELMEFPAKMTFKVAGINREGLAQDLIQVVQKYVKRRLYS